MKKLNLLFLGDACIQAPNVPITSIRLLPAQVENI
jgi:hypothetical protein